MAPVVAVHGGGGAGGGGADSGAGGGAGVGRCHVRCKWIPCETCLSLFILEVVHRCKTLF